MSAQSGNGGQRCGFVAVIGAPNAGKSTLINALVGSKVSIVSPKIQTTRTTVKGIALHEEAQIILIDTPGIFLPSKRLERAMVRAAWESREDADLVLLLVDVSKKKPLKQAQGIIERLKELDKDIPCALVLNKVDQIRPQELLPLSQTLNEAYDFAATFMISALNNNGTDALLAYIAGQMPEGDWLYPEDQMSDMPMRLLAAEITREKLFRQLHEELPYSLTVETEDWEDRGDGSVLIQQAIVIARENHKGIVLGKGGQRIKAIGEASRKELEEILECRVHLKLFVKVEENWSEDPETYALWGLDYRS